MLSSANDGIILVWSIGGGVADYIVVSSQLSFCVTAAQCRYNYMYAKANGNMVILTLLILEKYFVICCETEKWNYFFRQHTRVFQLYSCLSIVPCFN